MRVVLSLDSRNIANDNAQARMVYGIAKKHGLMQYLEIERAAKGESSPCRCITWGEDDGVSTCWVHHNCQDGSCTHAE